jgi:hypothetical protein
VAEPLASEKLDKHPYRTLVVFLAAGSSIFTLALFLLLYLITGVGGYRLDSSVVDFYPLLAGAGALFGFERWMYYESGGVNPFHDR